MSVIDIQARVGRRRTPDVEQFAAIADDWAWPDSTWGNATALDGALVWRQGEDTTLDQASNGFRIRDGLCRVGAGAITSIGIFSDTLNTFASIDPRRFYIARCENDLGTPDMYVRATFDASSGTLNNSSWFAIMARVGEGDTPDHYYAQLRADTDLRLISMVDGTETVLDSATRSHTPGDVYELRCFGTTISVWVNGTQQISVTNSAITSGSKMGLRARTTNTNSVHRCTAIKAGILDESGVPIEGPVKPPTPMLLWATQVGATTSTARISCQVRNAASARIVVSASPALTSPVYTSLYQEPDYLELLRFTPTGLTAGTDYHYGIQVDGVTLGGVRKLRTAPAGQASFSIGMGGDCASSSHAPPDTRSRNTSNAPAYEKITNRDPAFFFWAGDRHYRDYDLEHPLPHLLALRDSYENPRLDALTRGMPIIQMWDDHDFTGTPADISAPGRAEALEVFKAAVPAGDWLVDDDPLDPVGFTFTWGRTRWIILDHRSAASGSNKLGTAQSDALIDLLETATEPLIFLYVGVPWISSSGSDTWHGAPTQRQTIANAIEDHAKGRVAIIHADAHMIAIDDGTNSQYASGASAPGPPVLCASPIYAGTSLKGGPYSEGFYPPDADEPTGNRQQYVMFDIVDDGESIEVTWTGYQIDPDTLDESVVMGPFQFIAPVGGD